MQLILLSGGAGKRLWPMSNDTRSKQFLKLLSSPSGEMESMIQRVVRQVKEGRLVNEVTLATNSTQHDSIINQLGSEVNIVTEPERRDTFPAIALASGYLALEKGCGMDEVVVVMPCDVYTEAGYFDTIRKMAEVVTRHDAELVLMGIEPTYPSEKFGYIVPSKDLADTDALKVERFTEKPNRQNAEILLSQGAMWNGGVFAFRLGYLMDIVNRYIQVSTFAELSARYAEFPKISFDYEVVEKAGSVYVVPFSGLWCDLGTWNALCEKLPANYMGTVYAGDKNVNTHVINELDIPVVCNGLTDVVVAASYDGIMVCGKDDSENIKDYLNALTAKPRFEECLWGAYKVLEDKTNADGTRSVTKAITVKPGKSLCGRANGQTTVVWTIVNGTGVLELDGVAHDVKQGTVFTMRPGECYMLNTLTELSVIEVQMVASGDDVSVR